MNRTRDFLLERYFAKYEFSTQHLLCASDPLTMTVRDLMSLEPSSAESFNDLALGYSEANGHPELRALIAGLYTDVSADDVVVCTGAEEPVFCFMHAAISPGDHVVVQAPTYQSLYEMPRMFSADVALWKGPEHDGSGWWLEGLHSLIRDNTRAIIVNVPNNPTGSTFSQDMWSELLAFAQARGIKVFSDEVYRGLELDESTRLPAAVDVMPNSVSTGAFAKRFGLAGLRIGWFVTRDAGLRDRMHAAKDFTTICNSAPSEFLARIALRNRETIEARIKKTTAQNLDHLDAFFSRHVDRFEWRRPPGGTMAFPRLRKDDADTFCARIVDQAGVLLAPSTLFDHGSAHIRVGFGRADLPEAVAKLEAAL